MAIFSGSIHLYTAGVASGSVEALTPEFVIRLNAYLQSHPERSVLYRKDTREWIFTDDDPDGEVAAIPDSELGRHLSEFSGRAGTVNAIFAAEVEAACESYTDSGRQGDLDACRVECCDEFVSLPGSGAPLCQRGAYRRPGWPGQPASSSTGRRRLSAGNSGRRCRRARRSPCWGGPLDVSGHAASGIVPGTPVEDEQGCPADRGYCQQLCAQRRPELGCHDGAR